MSDLEEKGYGAVSPLPSCGMPRPSFLLGYLVGSWGGGEGKGGVRGGLGPGCSLLMALQVESELRLRSYFGLLLCDLEPIAYPLWASVFHL